MMMSNVRSHVGPVVAGSLAVLVTLVSASLAGAQQPGTALLSSTPIAAQAPTPVGITPPPAAVTPPPYWELISGYEGDTHGSGYGFAGPAYNHPLRPGLGLTARVFGTFLRYEFGNEFAGQTTVRSPGLSSAVGLRFGERTTFKVHAGPSIKWRREVVTNAAGTRVEDRDTRIGLGVGADLYTNPTPRHNIHALMNYSTEDKYFWSRVGVKQQVTNLTWSGTWAHFVGGEVIPQGNEDIRTLMVGGFLELLHVPNQVSVMLRAGYKRSTFDFGPDVTGPYFGVGVYHRLTGR